MKSILQLFKILRKCAVMPFQMEIEEMPEGVTLVLIHERAREVGGVALVLPSRTGINPKKAWIIKNKRAEGYAKKGK